jgi:predicted nucleotidyltransferase
MQLNKLLALLEAIYANDLEQLSSKPCLYELAYMWLMEHLLDYFTINPYMYQIN